MIWLGRLGKTSYFDLTTLAAVAKDGLGGARTKARRHEEGGGKMMWLGRLEKTRYSSWDYFSRSYQSHGQFKR